MDLEELKSLHDAWLREKPADGAHDSKSCLLCQPSDGGSSEHKSEGGAVVAGEEKTYTKVDIDAAVAAALAPVMAQLDELQSAAATSAVDAKIADAVAAALAPIEAELAEAKTKLDAAAADLDNKVVEAQVEKDRADGIVAWLEAEAETQTVEQALAARKAERVEQAKTSAGFTDEQLAEGDPTRADRFAAMDDEAWATQVDSWTAMRASAGSGYTPLPKTTALTASADEGADRRPASTLRDFAASHAPRVDVRGLNK